MGATLAVLLIAGVGRFAPGAWWAMGVVGPLVALEALRDLLAACGVTDLGDLRPDLFLEPNHWRHGRGAS